LDVHLSPDTPVSGGQSQQQGSPLQHLQPAQRPPAQPQPQPAAQLPRLAGLADGAGSSAAAAAAAVAAAAGPQQPARQSAAAGAQAAATASTQYLVGLWDTIRVDPSVWGFGFKMGVLQYQVKGATGRLLQWQCSSKPGWVPGVGLIPRLWRDAAGDLRPQSGLSTLESGQKRTWADMMAGGSSSASSSRAASTVASAVAEEDLQQVYSAAWMRPSPLRQHPLQRAAIAAAVVTAHRQQQLETQRAAAPAHCDLADPLTGREEPPETYAPWKAAYNRLQKGHLPRELVVFGWRLLHNALWVGARKMFFRPRLECVCQHVTCQQLNPQPLQTLSHVLLECPVAVEVWDWFMQLWRRIAPLSIVAASSQVVLLDELDELHVAKDLQPLWTRLRLLLLESLWNGRGLPSQGTAAQSAASIKHRFVAVLQQQVSNDWARTKHDIRFNAGVPASWFRGRSPELDVEAFEDLWCVHGVIAVVDRGGSSGALGLSFRLAV
jgi:hypothetical protein